MSDNKAVKKTAKKTNVTDSKAKTKAVQTKAKKAETAQVEVEPTKVVTTDVEQAKDKQTKSKATATTQKPKSLNLKPDQLVPFDNHPYKVVDNDSMDELTESIREHGILNPLIVRPIEDVENRYEIISGHRRFHAAERLGLKKVPCTVHFVDRDTATVMMVDSNCQRTELLPSEKAWAYKMKMDAIKRLPGRKPTGNGDPVGPNLKSAEKLAEENDDSPTQIKRYIRLPNLVPELLQFVDDGKIGMRPAVELSYLDEEVQRDIVDCIDEHNGEVFPSHAQARRIRDQFKNGGITYEQIAAIMDEQKPNQKQMYKVSEERISAITGKQFTPKEFEDYITKAVEYYNRYLQKQRSQDAR